ncbi:Hypothetical predicted protein [Drosophila guanche]|uniref:Uncharacterized protein n=2 Tax=Drosophila guanche TaxID=7266 RepID=A0A3B0K9N6_DROGU|nr:Hypothetical predicted protein [Drosophila guanche]
MEDETHSVTLSDKTATPRSRHTYVDDAYGNSLPPDLPSFPARVPPTSPSMQSSQSNTPDQVLYGIRSAPLASPVYAHMTPHGIYGTTTISAATNGFMTLQHPKARNLALIASNNSRQHQQIAAALHHQQAAASPFLPAPVVYSPTTAVLGSQHVGSINIPWNTASDFQSPTSPNPSETGTETTAELQAEPVYDNLGLRTTAGGNSTLNLPKALGAQGAQQLYSMRDRPLPATPSLTSVVSAANGTKIYEPIHELIQQQQQHMQRQHQQPHMYPSETESLSGGKNHGIAIIPGASISAAGLGNSTCFSSSMVASGSPTHSSVANSASPKIAKIPPRPPPKPKKKMSVTATRRGQGSTSQLFDDEGEDGTEV